LKNAGIKRRLMQKFALIRKIRD